MKDLYGDSMFDSPVKDPEKYRGRGRPRKTDYTTARFIQRRINEIFNNYLNKKLPL